MTLESYLASLNANIFWREFTFSKNQFFPGPGLSDELADSVVWIDDLLIACQSKERAGGTEAPERERRWFEQKVLGKATKQVRNTVRFLSEYDQIEIKNEREHVFYVNGRVLNKIIKLVVYAPGHNLPDDCRRIKHHVSTSSSAGFMHILPIQDYLEICRTLFTPAEIAEYFDFRERIISLWPQTTIQVSEQALVGQFLSGEEGIPFERYVEYLRSFENKLDDFDLTFLLRDFAEHTERVVVQSGDNDYYRILIEFAKLTRNSLREIKSRIKLCMDACNNKEFRPPMRIAVPETGCGFVLIPVPEGVSDPLAGLENFTAAAKYDLKVQRQIGISFAKEGREFLINWCFLDSAWAHDPRMEESLRDNYPFLPAKERFVPRYHFNRGAA